ncbi:MAG TPA: copper chaperone PCu(A)C [Steroidobacteraceae bacterium]|nr:copper chaperone PCu(A)C [Steroidobacteraceae bacterium]
MKHLLAAPFAALLLAGGHARANDAGAVRVSRAWIRVLPGDLPAGGYATLRNTGGTALTLIGARSANYRRVMLHKSMSVDGMSQMSMVAGVPLPAHGTVRLAPGGYHLMLMHAFHAVKPGDEILVSLQFADGSSLAVEFLARPANAAGAE